MGFLGTIKGLFTPTGRAQQMPISPGMQPIVIQTASPTLPPPQVPRTYQELRKRMSEELDTGARMIDERLSYNYKDLFKPTRVEPSLPEQGKFDFQREQMEKTVSDSLRRVKDSYDPRELIRPTREQPTLPREELPSQIRERLEFEEEFPYFTQ